MADDSEKLTGGWGWVTGFVGGAIIAVYLVVMVFGPFLVGGWVLNLTMRWEWSYPWAWVAAISVGFVMFFSLLMGMVGFFHEDKN